MTMRKMAAIIFVIVVTLYGGPRFVGAQEESPKPARPASDESKPKADQGRTIQPYRLDFSLNELEDGKKINSRHYSMNLTVGSADEVKIGTRVPVSTGSNTGQFQYMDVGTNIWANLREGGDDVQLEVRSEITDVDVGPGHERNTALPPIVRQMKINGTALLVTAKPTIIGSMDDPNSNRQFQLEVTATRLK